MAGGFLAIVYNNEKVYKELVFPVIQGTYYNPSELSISLNLSNTGSQSARVSYQVETNNKYCNITLVFVPTLEIARAMHKYRNSILKFNPRSYLELSNNSVNKDIAKSITGISTNEFALYNNGITMLSYGTDFNEKIGQKDRGQLIVIEPQIINGGQTAFTLSRVYEDNVLNGKNVNIFDNKEVLLKVITFQRENEHSETNYLDLIEAISKATNQQSQVNEADRRSNDHIQIKLQSNLYDKYGVFYERKLGEYADGIKSGYLQHSQIVERELFLRMCKCCDMEPADAKRMSSAQLFDIKNFEKTLTNPERFDEYLFAYQCFIKINEIKKIFLKIKNNKFGVLNYGSGLSQGIYGVVAVCKLQFKNDKSFTEIDDVVTSTLNKWKDFENSVIRFPENSDYFRFYIDDETKAEKEELNFSNYYKGKTVAKNLTSFFAQLLK